MDIILNQAKTTATTTTNKQAEKQFSKLVPVSVTLISCLILL